MKRLAELADRAWSRLPLHPRLLTLLVFAILLAASRNNDEQLGVLNLVLFGFNVIAGVWAYFVYRARSSDPERSFSRDVALRAMAGTILIAVVVGLMGIWYFELAAYTRVSMVIWAYLAFQVAAYPRTSELREGNESPLMMYARWHAERLLNRRPAESRDSAPRSKDRQ